MNERTLFLLSMLYLVGAHGVEVDTSCYFVLPCRFLNFKLSSIIFPRAILSNQCTSLRKLHLYSGACGLLMAALHIFLFPHLHSKCITTTISVVYSTRCPLPPTFGPVLVNIYNMCLSSHVGVYIYLPCVFSF